MSNAAANNATLTFIDKTAEYLGLETNDSLYVPGVGLDLDDYQDREEERQLRRHLAQKGSRRARHDWF